MTFAAPLGLLGLLSVPVIVALHFLKERNRSYMVSDLNLWSFLPIEVRGSRLRRIPLNWLLIIDVLIAILLSLALSQPQIYLDLPGKNARHLVIILDDSTSMRSHDLPPDRFFHARLEALNLLSTLGPRDVATIYTFGSTPELVGDTRRTELPELLSRVTALEAGGTGEALVATMALAAEALDESLPPEIHVFTDTAFEAPVIGTIPFPVELHIVGRSNWNQAVIEISTLLMRDGGTQVFARIANMGNLKASGLITLLADGDPIDSSPLTLKPNSETTQIWTIEGQPSYVSVILVGEDDLADDNTATVGIPPDMKVRVGLVASNPDPLDKAFQFLENVDLRVLTPEEYTPGMIFDLTIFREYLPDSWPTNTVLVVEPPEETVLMEVGELVEVGVPIIAFKDELLQGVDFGGVRWEQAASLITPPEGYELLLVGGEEPLLFSWFERDSEIIVFLPMLGQGNLIRHPSFPILMANIASQAKSVELANKLYTGEPILIPSYEQYPAFRIVPPNGELIDFGKDRPGKWTETLAPGAYVLEFSDSDGVPERYHVGVNAGNVVESEIDPRNWTLDQREVEDVQQVPIGRSIHLNTWLLGIAAALLIIEARMAWR